MCIEAIGDSWREGGLMEIKEIANIGITGLVPFAYTWAIVCGMTKDAYKYRYCYESLLDAHFDFKQWNGDGDPPGNWIKKKGSGHDFKNPNYDDGRGLETLIKISRDSELMREATDTINKGRKYRKRAMS